MTSVPPASLRAWLVSLGVLLGSYLVARLAAYLLGLMLRAATHKTATDLDERLLSAAKRPVTYLLFLVGAGWALLELPASPELKQGLGSGLYVAGAGLVAWALMRAFGILLAWYARTPRFAEGDGLATEFAPLVAKLGKVFIFLVAAIAILTRLGVNVASLVVSLGVGSLAVGLAAQDTLANMFAGFTLLMDRPFRLGDRIRLASGELGDVETIGMRATRIRTLDDTLLVVPNGLLVKERVVNLTRPTRSVTTRAEVLVAYGTDLATAKQVLSEAVRAVEYVDPLRPPVVLVTRLADLGVQLLAVFQARDYTEQGLALSGVYEEVERRFRAAGIEIPAPVLATIQDGIERPREVPAS